MSSYETEVDGYISEISKRRYNELVKIKEIFHKIEEDAKELIPDIIVDGPKPDLKDLETNVVAADGGSYQEEYEATSILLAVAYAYFTKGCIERYLPKISIIPPYYSSLVNSVSMKTLEYQITHSVLEELNKSGNFPKLVFLDGTITFPDNALFEHVDRVPWINEVHDEYVKVSTEFFNYLKDEDIPVIAVVKDSQANKYFLSLVKSLSNGNSKNEFTDEDIQSMEELISKWKPNGEYSQVSEYSMIKYLFKDKNLKRTKYVEVTQSLRSEVPIEMLQGNIIGMYIKINTNQKPFFIEIPGFFKHKLDQILQLFTSFSYFSLRPGYPLPLFAAHMKVQLRKKSAHRIIQLLKNFTRKDLPEYYHLLYEEKFHERL
ncbi:MAG: DNA double-strand break repair nuclease NurA [Candidatus Freyarchaeum deiterrae]